MQNPTQPIQSADTFLNAWKQGVKFVGEEFFNVTVDHVDAASDRNQLRPNLPMIRKRFGVLSRGEAIICLAMAGFYNPHFTANFIKSDELEHLAVSGAIAFVDIPRTQILRDLIMTYKPW